MTICNIYEEPHDNVQYLWGTPWQCATFMSDSMAMCNIYNDGLHDNAIFMRDSMTICNIYNEGLCDNMQYL